MTTSMNEKIRNLVNVSVLIIILIALLIAGESILMPAAWALIFAFIGLPIAHFLERKKWAGFPPRWWLHCSP